VPWAARRPDPPPLQTNDLAAVLVGTVAFAITSIALAISFSTSGADGHLWWLQSTIMGVGLGLVGAWYVDRRRTTRRLGRRGSPGGHT
jgi:hypothetical protein